VTPDISPLRRVSLRWLLWRYLERGERVIAEGAVRDLDTYRLAWLVVTPTRLLLCYTSEGDTVYTLRFGDVQQALHRRGAMKLTARSPGMLDADEVYELTIQYGKQRAMELALIDGVRRLSPLFRFSRSNSERFRRAARTPVAQWLTCPACVVELDERVEHAAHCTRCGRYYADSRMRPVVDLHNGDAGRLVGAEARTDDGSGVFGVVRPFVLREESEDAPPELAVDRSLDRPLTV
jgi:hypothetical protein